MARFHISVKPYRSDERPNAKWVLNVWYPDGRRERRFFATKDEALAEQTAKEVEAENFGLRALQIDDRLRLEALDAKEKLAPYGVSLMAVIAEFIRRRCGEHGTCTFSLPWCIPSAINRTRGSTFKGLEIPFAELPRMSIRTVSW